MNWLSLSKAMPYYPMAPSSDDRRARGLTPIRLVNLEVTPVADASTKQTRYALTPAPGLRVVINQDELTPADDAVRIKGVFADSGVRFGVLHVVTGRFVHTLSNAQLSGLLAAEPPPRRPGDPPLEEGDPGRYVTNPVVLPSTVAGRVRLDGFREQLLIQRPNDRLLALSEGSTGVQLVQTTDVDYPTETTVLAVISNRAVVAGDRTDSFYWSRTLNATDWPAAAFATAERRADPILAVARVSSDLWLLGARSLEPWQVTGGEDDEAFAPLGPSIVDNLGILSADAWARVDEQMAFVGSDRVAYLMAGYTPQRLTNRALEAQLQGLTEAEAAEVRCFSWRDGSKLQWAVRPPRGPGWVYDFETQSWGERESFGLAAWRVGGLAEAYARRWVNEDNSPILYEHQRGWYTEARGPIRRVATLQAPVTQRTPVFSVTLDARVYDAPAGSQPECLMRWSHDGGATWSSEAGFGRPVKLGRPGADRRPTVWNLGTSKALDGLLIEVSWTDPVGVALHGLWINEGAP